MLNKLKSFAKKWKLLFLISLPMILLFVFTIANSFSQQSNTYYISEEARMTLKNKKREELLVDLTKLSNEGVPVEQLFKDNEYTVLKDGITKDSLISAIKFKNNYLLTVIPSATKEDNDNIDVNTATGPTQFVLHPAVYSAVEMWNEQYKDDQIDVQFVQNQ